MRKKLRVLLCQILMNVINRINVLRLPFLLLIISIWFISCQEENDQVSPPNAEETLVANTTLPRLLERITLLDGSIDNMIDTANCFLVELPVTVSVGGTSIVVNSVNDYASIVTLLNQQNTDVVSIMFPITIILSDYTEITIENEEQLASQIASCANTNQPDIDIECIDFVYPFSIALFDTNFEVTETITISGDQLLHDFLTTTLANGVVASINYPIQLVQADGTILTVTNNASLEAAIIAAQDTCDEDDDTNYNDANCTEVFIRENLLNCFWRITDIATGTQSDYDFYFNDNQTFSFSQHPTSSVAYSGSWELLIYEGNLVLNISNLSTDIVPIEGFWIFDECYTDELLLHNGNQEIRLEKVCENTTPFECFDHVQTTICDEENPFDGFVEMDLEALFIDTISCTQPYTFSFHQTQLDADTNVNPIQPNSYTNTALQETLYLRIEDVNGIFEIYTINIMVEDCCANNTIITDHLVLYMPFANETKDLVSNWEASGSYTYVSDRAGNQSCAIAFNGNETVEIPVTNVNQIVQGDAFSVSLWFKMQNTNPSNYEILFQKGNMVSEGFQISVFDLNTPVFSDANSGYGLWDNPWNMDANLPTDTTNWHHLVLTVDASNTVRLYRDGIERNADVNATINIGNTPLMNYLLGNGFEGHLDDIRVYKTALNPNQVANLYTLEADCNICL